MVALMDRLAWLQIFAEGGDGGNAGAGVGADGAPAADAGQQTGVSAGDGAEAAAAGQPQEEQFGDLIAGRYKADFER